MTTEYIEMLEREMKIPGFQVQGRETMHQHEHYGLKEW